MDGSAGKGSHGNGVIDHSRRQPSDRLERTNSANSASSSASDDEDGFILLDSSNLRTSPGAPSLLLNYGGDPSCDNRQAASTAPKSGGGAHMHPYAVEGAYPDDLDPLKQPPASQAMVRAAEANEIPDPYRIPSSVFARAKSNAPCEWSVASNESLFSIHMGGNSFSRDHVFLLGKSGELPSYLNSPMDAHGNLIMPMDPFPPPPQPQGPGGMRGGDQYGLRMEKEQDKTGRTASTPRQSDGSVSSIQSFAFPILTGEARGGSMKGEPPPQYQLHSPQGGVKAQQDEKTAANTTEAAANPAMSWWPAFLRCSFCCRQAPGGD